MLERARNWVFGDLQKTVRYKSKLIIMLVAVCILMSMFSLYMVVTYSNHVTTVNDNVINVGGEEYIRLVAHA